MKNIILVVEITTFNDKSCLYSIKKEADTLEDATAYLVALNTLNKKKNTSYEMFNPLGQSHINRKVA